MAQRGLTLLEILICAGLFSLALALCGQLALAGVRTRQQAEDRNGAFRQVVTLFHQLQRDIQQSRQIYCPDPDSLAVHHPGQGSSALVLRVVGEAGMPGVVAWTLSEGELIRRLYRNDFNPAWLITQAPLPGSQLRRSPGVKRFSLQLQPPGKNYGSRLLVVDLEFFDPVPQRLTSTLLLSY